VLLEDALDKYSNDHIARQERDDVYAASKGNKMPDAPAFRGQVGYQQLAGL
jgi:hypothetical protein